MRILGIEIERRTDILAFTAFTISIGNLILQGFNLIKGPKLVLDPPKQILISKETYGNEKYIIISARMSYFNRGSPNHHDVIKLEEAYINFPVQKKTIKLNAQKYIHSERENDKLEIENISDAMPFQVESGNVKSHETLFVPRTSNTSNKLNVNENFLKYSELLNLLKQNKEINIRLISRNLRNKEKEVTCNLITKNYLENLKRKKWAAPSCTNN